jgi:hypothetical protein
MSSGFSATKHRAGPALVVLVVAVSAAVVVLRRRTGKAGPAGSYRDPLGRWAGS